MTSGMNIEDALVQWGERLFYPGNRAVRNSMPRLTRDQRAARVRDRLGALARRVPQVMVKVTGGGRGMKAIAAHFRYIGKRGKLEVEDELGRRMSGPEVAKELKDDWQCAGTWIPDESSRREAFNVMVSMPRGTADGSIVLKAAREFARAEFAGHKYVVVLHDHQANPHVHISVRAEGRDGQRLNPRKADLQRWRETFAERLRGWGIEAEATGRSIRANQGRSPSLWQLKASEAGRHRQAPRSAGRTPPSVLRATEALEQLRKVLAASDRQADRELLNKLDSSSRAPARGDSGRDQARR